ncbi:Nif3-like dinuclear metal center hexameric protein [Virgibacillus salexigens]|uniref:Nif3-like dinuclear metal center hexameric protein n=1 Tax=Virgibacillus salexigens TaxID=61016 RepID=UPI00190D61C3|nr:Nif3-like dinuclear metal center hexameric protein [Virgibacillus salexigens]
MKQIQLTNRDIFKVMEALAPTYLAYDWDNVGLQVGAYNKPVSKIMITLDVLENVVDEAIEKHVDLIIAHHPLLFKPLRQLNMDTPSGKIMQKLVNHGITVYASHTNLDAAIGGVNDQLADAIGLTSSRVLVDEQSKSLVKLAVYVPISHIDQVREAISKAGAGHIGNYSHCTFHSHGQGTFKPLEGTNPFIGNTNQLEKVEEAKLETIVEEHKLSSVLEQMIDAHPYEEVAYDIYPLGNKGEAMGLGRVGHLEEKMVLRDFVEKVKSAFQMENVRVTGNLDKKVKTIAILGGSGEKYIHQAKLKGADVYITGDMTFHIAQDAWQIGLAVIDSGHYAEKIMKDAVKNYLNDRFKDMGIEVITSTTNTDPFQFM